MRSACSSVRVAVDAADALRDRLADLGHRPVAFIGGRLATGPSDASPSAAGVDLMRLTFSTNSSAHRF